MLNQIKTKISRRLSVAAYLLFISLSVFYLFWFDNHLFFYQEKSSLFLFSFSYLAQHLNQPGAFLVYLNELQTTFYYYPLLGAVLVSLEIALTVGIFKNIAKKLFEGEHSFFPFLIGALMFFLQIHYQFSTINNLAILINVALFNAALSYTKQKAKWIPVILFPFVYFLFGTFSDLFLGLFSVYLVLTKDWKKLVALYFWSLLFFYIGRESLFFQSDKILISYPFSATEIGTQMKVFLILIGLIVFFPVLIRIRLGRNNWLTAQKSWLSQLSPFLLMIALVLVIIPATDKKISHYFHVEKLFYEHKYKELIDFNRQFPSTNMLTNYLNNIALAETGRLDDELFSYPQSQRGETLFLKWDLNKEVLKRGGYFYYTIGLSNEAQRWAYEYMVMQGYTPEGIKMLMKTELIAGNYKMAARYIDILKHTLFYRKEATRYEKLLNDPEAIKNEPELLQKRKLQTQNDFFVLSDNPVLNIDLILQKDSLNLIALEYKFASLMLNKDVNKIVEYLPMLEKCGYKRIPKNIEEAAIGYKLLRTNDFPELNTLFISNETEGQFSQFNQVFMQNRSNKGKAQKALSSQFAHTFWFYLVFG